MAIIAFLFSFIIGIRVGSHRRGTPISIAVSTSNESMIYLGAVVFAGIGVVAWLYMLANVGGFAVAYGISYGGGSADSGFVVEARFLGIVAAPLVMLARRKRGLRAIDWGVITVAIAPIIIHGILGARRGPTFIALATVGAGYIILFRKRISLITFLSGGFAIGVLLLFLLANRSGIFWGSQASLDAPLLDYLSPSYGNEYLYGSAIFRFVNSGESFRGTRIAAHIIGHLIPGQIWPDKYYDLIRIFDLHTDLQINSGVPNEAIASRVGWMPANGAAPAMFGDFWLEFGAGSLALIYLVGWIYGYFWRVSENNVSFQVVYLLLVGFSLYLTTQGIQAWLFRAILFGIPGWIAVRSVAHRARFLSRGAIGRSMLQVGDLAPAIVLQNAKGEIVDVGALCEQGPVIVIFYRGGWCPYCNLELKIFQEMLPDIQAAGAWLVAISPEKPDEILPTAEKNALAFEVLSDADQRVGREFGFVYEFSGDRRSDYSGFRLDMPARRGSAGKRTVPFLSTYIIDCRGKIIYGHTDDYGDRANARRVPKFLSQKQAPSDEQDFRALYCPADAFGRKSRG